MKTTRCKMPFHYAGPFFIQYINCIYCWGSLGGADPFQGDKTAPQKLSIMNDSPLGLYPPSLSAVIVPSLSALHVLPNILFWNDSASPCGLVFVSCWFKGVFLVWFKKFGSTVRMIIPAFVCVSRRHNKTSNNKFDWNMHEQAAESAT